MKKEVHQVRLGSEFRVCPTCGYKDGFHSIFRREEGVVAWLFICPSCHELFDIGMTVPEPSPKKEE